MDEIMKAPSWIEMTTEAPCMDGILPWRQNGITMKAPWNRHESATEAQCFLGIAMDVITLKALEVPWKHQDFPC